VSEGVYSKDKIDISFIYRYNHFSIRIGYDLLMWKPLIVSQKEKQHEMPLL